MADRIEEIRAYIREHQDAMIDDLKYLVSFPSVQSEAQPDAPFGIECARCLEAAAELYRKHGFKTEVYPGSGYALVHLKPDADPDAEYMGIFGHSDVVPVTPEDWIRTKPFEAVEQDGLLYGRGIGDNKCAVVGMLYIMMAFRDLGIETKHDVVSFIGSNEESGMADIENFVKEQKMPKTSIIPDSGFPASFGERGILRVDVHSRKAFRDISVLNGGNAYNTVMASLDCAVPANEQTAAYLNRNPQEWLEFHEKDGKIFIHVNGISAHAGGPANGVSALKRLCDLLVNCESLDSQDRQQLGYVKETLEDCYGVHLGIDGEDPVMGKLTCANGIVRLEEKRMMYTFDIRYGTNTTADAILDTLRSRFAEYGFEIGIARDARAFLISDDNPFGQKILEAYRETTGEKDAKSYTMAGGTYCKHLVNAFATGTRYNEDRKRANLPQGHGGAHQADEFIEREGYLNGLAILANMILKMDQAY